MNRDVLSLVAHVEKQSDGECIVATTVLINGAITGLITKFNISCGPNWRLADRLVAAISAGHVLTDHRLVTDKQGQAYIASTCRINLIHMSAELRRLGF